MWVIFSIIAILFFICVFFSYSLGDNATLSSIHYQLEWIAIILFVGFAIVDYKFTRLIDAVKSLKQIKEEPKD